MCWRSCAQVGARGDVAQAVAVVVARRDVRVHVGHARSAQEICSAMLDQPSPSTSGSTSSAIPSPSRSEELVLVERHLVEVVAYSVSVDVIV